MNVSEWMSQGAHTCTPSDTLAHAAKLMWEHDVGALPVVTHDGRTVGMITDRDICMAAYTQGKPLAEISVGVAASRNLVAVHPEDDVDLARVLMETARIRRLPVIDHAGRPVGLVGLADMARNMSSASKQDGASADAIARTLAAVSQARALGAPRPKPGPVFHVRWIEDGWEVRDRRNRRVSSERVYTQAEAVIHAKQLARHGDSAQIIIHDVDGNVTSDFFYQRDEREALDRDDSVPTMAASQPAHMTIHH